MEVTGLKINVESRSQIVSSDSIALLIALNDEMDFTLFEVRRRPSDFTKLHGSCWPKEAEFYVAPSGHPFVLLPDEAARKQELKH